MVLSARREQPDLNVVVLNYNYGRFLRECLDSILGQQGASFEVVVIDDASDDESFAVLRECESDRRVRVVRHAANQGWVRSLIEGTEELSGSEFVTVVSADDLALERDAFATQVAALRDEREAVACMASFRKFGREDNEEIRRPLPQAGRVEGKDLIRRLLTDRECSFLHSGTVIRKSAYEAAGGYRADLRNYLDLAMWIGLARQGPIVYIDKPLFAYRIHPAQFSGSRDRRMGVLREGIALLASECARSQDLEMDLARTAVLRARIADLALADAFAGRRMLALRRCLDAATVEPWLALTASGWWLALARSLANDRGWRIASRLRRLFRL